MHCYSITEHLKLLGGRGPASSRALDSFPFGDARYTIRVASDLESRRKAYRLVYRLYIEKEYARPRRSRMWLSIFDALPETATLLVEREAVEGGGWKVEGDSSNDSHQPSTPNPQPPTPVGTLTIVSDSPMGLPAEDLYGAEVGALRASGRKVAEGISLGVAEESLAGAMIVGRMLNLGYLIAREIRGTTDFLVTANPMHVRFYEAMHFVVAGPERSYGKVGGAPAVLLRLDLEALEHRLRTSAADPAGRQCVYRQFRTAAEAPETMALLGAALRPMTEEERDYFLVAETDTLAQASAGQRAALLAAYAGVGAS
jgi:hypothetical protein